MPLPPSIAYPLLEGSKNEAIARENKIRDIIPQQLMTCREVIGRAIQKDSLQIVETRWTDAGEIKPPEWAHKGDAPQVFTACSTGTHCFHSMIICLEACSRPLPKRLAHPLSADLKNTNRVLSGR
jgi:hypothetical protein